MKRIFGLVLAAFFLFSSTEVKARDFAEMNHETILKALVRFGALNINNDEIIDAYGVALECDLYKHFFPDDFKWQKVRKALRQKIKNEVSLYPTGLQYNTKLQLDRYDFKEKLFKFSERATIKNTNAFLMEVDDLSYCGNRRAFVFPKKYRAVLDHSLYVTGLPFSEEDANALLKRLKAAGNQDRIIYTRFNFRIAYIAPLRKKEGAQYYIQASDVMTDAAVRMDVGLESIEFFEDEAKTKLIYTYSE